MTLIVLTASSATYCQNKLPDLAKPAQMFAALYYQTPLQQNETWTQRQTRVNDIFFSIYNEYLTKYLSRCLEGLDEKAANSMVMEIADSLNTMFMRDHAFDSTSEDTASLRELLPDIAESLCSCINSKITYKDSIISSEYSKWGGCFNILMSDEKMAARIRAAFAGYSLQQKMTVSKLVPLYSAIHCNALYKFYKRIMVTTAVQQFANGRREYLTYMPELLGGLYRRHKTDSLKMVFTGFEKFEGQIASFSSLHLEFAKRDIKFTGENIILTTTYASNRFKKSHVEAQTIIYFTNTPAPKAFKFSYVPRDKITNLASIENALQEMDMVAPPPQQDVIVAPGKN
jgi:hypothetical protein